VFRRRKERLAYVNFELKFARTRYRFIHFVWNKGKNTLAFYLQFLLGRGGVVTVCRADSSFSMRWWNVKLI